MWEYLLNNIKHWLLGVDLKYQFQQKSKANFHWIELFFYIMYFLKKIIIKFSNTIFGWWMDGAGNDTQAADFTKYKPELRH